MYQNLVFHFPNFSIHVLHTCVITFEMRDTAHSPTSPLSDPVSTVAASVRMFLLRRRYCGEITWQLYHLNPISNQVEFAVLEKDMQAAPELAEVMMRAVLTEPSIDIHDLASHFLFAS